MGNAGYIGKGSVGLWMMGLLLVMTGGGGTGELCALGLEVRHGGYRVVAESGGEVNSANDEVRNRGVLYAWALAVVFGGLFVVILMMAMARSGRFFRKHHRIGVKEKPTKHIDVWSQYRLRDSDWDDADEDEL